jgi:hypothetical protein
VEIAGLLLIAALGWLWYDSLKVREVAVAAAREACAAEGVQLLDDTVGIASLKLARNAAGRVQLQRAYDFEFSDTGNNRLRGGVVLLGTQVTLLSLATARDGGPENIT